MDNLLERDADIAVRMTKQLQDTLVTHHLGNFKMGDMSVKVIWRRTFLLRLKIFHHLIGLVTTKITTSLTVRSLGIELTRESFAIRCDNHIADLQAMLNGLGIGFGFTLLVKNNSSLARILPEGWIPDVPVWLTAHLELRSNPRIRAVYDHLAEQFIEFINHQ